MIDQSCYLYQRHRIKITLVWMIDQSCHLSSYQRRQNQPEKKNLQTRKCLGFDLFLNFIVLHYLVQVIFSQLLLLKSITRTTIQQVQPDQKVGLQWYFISFDCASVFSYQHCDFLPRLEYPEGSEARRHGGPIRPHLQKTSKQVNK